MKVRYDESFDFKPAPMSVRSEDRFLNILMPLMAGMIDQFYKRDNMANAQEGLGLMTVENYINQAIE